jgi:hypothetical protein
MQPFDGDVFDRRYEEIFEPAIQASGLTPYRVDKDLQVSIPIDDIQRGIRDSDICLAEITTDNPNVWFELGYAMACRKEVVLLCSDERKTRFPFDVQHRTIIKYNTKSIGDYKRLRKTITAKIKAYVLKSSSASTSAPKSVDWSKVGNTYWLGHDVMWTIHALWRGAPRSWITHGLRQSLHHTTLLGLRETSAGRQISDLYEASEVNDDADFTEFEKENMRLELRRISDQIGTIAEAAQPKFDAGPMEHKVSTDKLPER